jgi:hypothetical protein
VLSIATCVTARLASQSRSPNKSTVVVSPLMSNRVNLDRQKSDGLTTAQRFGFCSCLRFCACSASRFRYDSPSTAMTSAWCVSRSISATAQAAFGKTVSHCLKGRFNAEPMVMRSLR